MPGAKARTKPGCHAGAIDGRRGQDHAIGNDQGIVLASHLLAGPALNDGKLIELVPQQVTRRERWFLAGDQERITGDAESRLWGWLASFAQESSHEETAHMKKTNR